MVFFMNSRTAGTMTITESGIRSKIVRVSFTWASREFIIGLRNIIDSQSILALEAKNMTYAKLKQNLKRSMNPKGNIQILNILVS